MNDKNQEIKENIPTMSNLELTDLFDSDDNYLIKCATKEIFKRLLLAAS